MRHLLPSLFNQKGAMYGLDGRVALIVFAALSTIAGASIFFNRTNAQAATIHQELNSIHTAIKNIQSDFENDLYASLNSGTAGNISSKALWALYEEEHVDPNYLVKWHGPYLDEFINPVTRAHRTLNNVVDVAIVSIMKAPKIDSIATTANCSNLAPCYYWVRLDGVTEKLAQAINDRADPATEAAPANEGRVQWNASAVPGSQRLWYLTERALDNNNASVGE